MAKHKPENLHNEYPAISPYSSQSHSRRAGTGSHTFTKLGFRIAAPLLLIGVCASVVVAANSSNSAITGTKTSTAEINVSHQATPDSNVSKSVTPVPTDSANTSASGNTATNGSSTTVTVNGQTTSVPANGSVQKSVMSSDGSTDITVTTNSSSNGDNFGFTSTNLNVSSDSWSDDGTGYTVVNGQPYYWSSP